MGSAQRPLFQVRELSKVYGMGDVEVHALRRIDLSLPEGEFVVLLGPSGSGKSTLLNIIGGLDVPTSGEVFYRDTELTRASDFVFRPAIRHFAQRGHHGHAADARRVRRRRGSRR